MCVRRSYDLRSVQNYIDKASQKHRFDSAEFMHTIHITSLNIEWDQLTAVENHAYIVIE